MIGSITTYYVHCDGGEGCVECIEECNNERDAHEQAIENQWTNSGEKYYCPECADKMGLK